MTVSRWAVGRLHYRRSLASRVTLLATIAVAFAVALLSVTTYLVVSIQMQRNIDASLLERARAAGKDPTVLNTMTERKSARFVAAADVRVIFYDIESGPVVGDRLGMMPLNDSEIEVAEGKHKQSMRTVYFNGGRWRMVAVQTNNYGEALILAQPLEDLERILKRLGIVMLVFGLLGVVGAGIAGWAVARNGLRPVRRLTASVEHIARTEDLEPLRVEGADEVARLATAFNHLLRSVSASRDRQRRLVGDASHELRTPLTSIRTNIDLLTQASESGRLSEEQRSEMLTDIRLQMDEMTQLIQDLVHLAREEEVDPQPVDLDLRTIVEQALERVRLRAQDISFDTDLEPLPAHGDPAALERAVLNLLDNAVKWSPPDATVGVSLRDGTLTVDDEGPGIPEENRTRVFERFWRTDESRALPGSGLGLSIVQQVAERHGGSVSAGASPRGGARLQLSLPRRQS